jgi:radical SAM superfamily enzyme YgiQ (UPF0313 family)
MDDFLFALVAIDSQYIHSNLAVRSLAAACSRQAKTVVKEYNINQPRRHAFDDLLTLKPQVIGFSCYLWNIDYVLRLCADLKKVLPQICLLLGGPEVSYTPAEYLQENPQIDYILCGEGEESLPLLLDMLRKGETSPRLPGLTYQSPTGPAGDNGLQLVHSLAELPDPYNGGAFPEGKIIYYETTRGCPFSCAYCLSGAMGGGVRELPMERVKREISALVRRGVPLVKFVDRTFNANPRRAAELVRFLLSEECAGVTRFHMEIGADLLNSELLDLFAQAPKGKFQLEAGVQSCNEQTLRAVVRTADWETLKKNVQKLMQSGRVHLHLDLIAGLPYEDIKRFSHSFNEVYALDPHHLQLGFLKLLKGSALRKNAEQYGIVYRDDPPYEVLFTPWLTAEELLFLKDLAEVLDRYINSGRARRAIRFLIGVKYDSPFLFYSEFTQFCREAGALSRPLSAENQAQLLGKFAERKLDTAQYREFLYQFKVDYLCSGAKGTVPPIFLPIEVPSDQLRAAIQRRKAMGVLPEKAARNVKFDLLPDPKTLRKGLQLVMVDKSEQDELTGDFALHWFP